VEDLGGGGVVKVHHHHHGVVVVVVELFGGAGTEGACECDLSICEEVFTLEGWVGAGVGTVDFDVEDGEFDEVGDGREGVEWGTPEYGSCDVACLECDGVDKVDGVADASAYRQRADVGKGSSLFRGDTNQIVFANGWDLNGVGEFEGGGVGVSVCGDDLFGGFGADRNDAREEFDHFDSVASLAVKKV